jgi:hypothetical protein
VLGIDRLARSYRSAKTWNSSSAPVRLGYGPKDEFDHGGCVARAYLYKSYDCTSSA